jgi:hypothetical protein
MPRNPESTYSFSQPTENAFIIEGLSENDRLSLIGPGGINIVSQKDTIPTTYRIPGVVGLDVSAWVSKDKLIVYTRNEMVGEAVDEWLTQHFEDVNRARRITEGALRRYTSTRTKQSE